MFVVYGRGISKNIHSMYILYSVYINAFTIVSLKVASLRLIGGKKSNMGKCSCHRSNCKIQFFAMHTCKHTALANIQHVHTQQLHTHTYILLNVRI